jgi:hypothetical protein
VEGDSSVFKKVAAVSAVLVVLAAAGASAGSPRDRVTGGGQTLVGTRGAGNTIAFTIQGAGADVKGQFQYVDRTAGTGQSQDSWHGSPTCLEVAGNTAKAVISRNDTGALYELLIVDNGQGAAADDDLVTLTQDEEPTCGSDDDDDDVNTALARGNVQVYDAP